MKECERLHRSSHKPLDIFDLNECSKFPVQLERFWSSFVNKEGLLKLSQQYFSKVSVEGAKILFSAYVENQDDGIDCIELNGDSVENQRHLTSCIEEADLCIIPCVYHAVTREVKRIVVVPNDTDVVVLLLFYML